MIATEREEWIAQYREAIAAFCEEWQITEFALAGPILTEDADPDRAISVMVYFSPETRHSLFNNIDMEDELAEIFGRRVELVSRPGNERNRNDILRKVTAGEAQMVVSRDDGHAQNLIEAAQDIQAFVMGQDRAAFEVDKVRQNAVIWAIVMIGKAAERLSNEFKDGQPDIPWDELIADAEALLGSYRDVDLDHVWMVVMGRVPVLLERLKSLPR